MKDLNPKFVSGKILRGEYEIKQLSDILSGLDCFICGGFAKFACSPRKSPAKAGDIDIYSSTNDEFDKVCQRLESKKFLMTSESPAQKSFKDERFKLFGGKIDLTIQVIKPIKQGNVVLVGTAEDILGNFDFTVSRVAIKLDGSVIMDEDFEKHEKEKKLCIKAIHCPIAQVYRIAKYTKKGYFCSVSEVLKLFTDWDSRDVDYKRDLAKMIALDDPTKDEIEILERFLHVD